jgi:hypothetical protein
MNKLPAVEYFKTRTRKRVRADKFCEKQVNKYLHWTV